MVSIPKIINVLMMSSLFFLIFAIIGVNFLKGIYFHCVYAPNLNMLNVVNTKWQCFSSGGTWESYPTNFDNVGSSFGEMFIMSQTVGYALTMYRGMAAQGIDLNPI
jgi:hypothetical protein